MTVHIPGPLRMYTKVGEVAASGKTLDDVLWDLDARYPGMRFRMIDEQGGIRPHIRYFINSEIEWNLKRILSDRDELYIICALSGGLR